MNKLMKMALLAFAGVCLLGTSAMAQSFNFGDLLLDFRLANNTSSNNLEVDLGTFNFNQSQAVVSGFSATDLTQAYGSFASQGSNLVFNLSATDDNKYLIVSNPGNSTTLTKNNPQASNGNITQVANLYGESNGTQVTGGDNAFIVTPVGGSTGDSNSYVDVLLNVNKDYAPNQFANDFGFASYNMEQAYKSTGSSITVYDQTGTASSALGTFTLSGAGTLSYNVAATPEPSTYLLMALGGVVLFFVRRRMIQA